MTKRITLNYDGYWRENNFLSVPKTSGVYTFFECSYNADKKTITLLRTLYIGQAEDCYTRITSHDKIPALKKSLTPGNQLCVHIAEVLAVDKDRTENALVFYHKPPFNDKLKDEFSYDETTISCSGRYGLLTQNFTVQKKPLAFVRW